MSSLKIYERPSITTLDSEAILDRIGPAQATASGNYPNPYSEVTPSSGGGSSKTFGR